MTHPRDSRPLLSFCEWFMLIDILLTHEVEHSGLITASCLEPTLSNLISAGIHLHYQQFRLLHTPGPGHDYLQVIFFRDPTTFPEAVRWTHIRLRQGHRISSPTTNWDENLTPGRKCVLHGQCTNGVDSVGFCIEYVAFLFGLPQHDYRRLP